MSKEYAYSLAKKGKVICPACGKRTFVLYVDSDGKSLNDDVGKCDRADKCNYHYTPREYFRDKGISLDTLKTRRQPISRHRTHGHDKPIYMKPTLLKESMSPGDNNLVTFLHSVFKAPGSDQRITDIINMYYIGNNSDKWPGATVFWRIDQYGNIHSGKIMQYDPHTGKRVKEPFNKVTWMHTMIGDKDFKIRPCLYGQHLIDGIDQIDKYIVVESEKTAILLTMAFDDAIGIATGGCEAFKKESCQALKDHDIFVIPDNGKYREWSKVAREIAPLCHSIRVLDIMEFNARKDGDDIGDLIVELWSKNSHMILADMLKDSLDRCKPI